MRTVRVAAAALNQTPLDWEGNKARIIRAIEFARAERANVLVLPELSITGYGCEDAFFMPGLIETATAVLGEILPTTKGLVVAVGLPVLYNRALFDVACLIADGRILGFAPKQHLSGDGLQYEPRWFKPWPRGAQGEISLSLGRFPIGDFGFEIDGVTIGFEICEDAWVADRTGRDLATRGVDLLLNPSASHFAFGKRAVRERFVLEGSRSFSTTYVYANLLGCEAGRVIYDGDCLIASEGKLVAVGPRLSFEEVVVTAATIDLDAVRINQAKVASFEPSMKRGGVLSFDLNVIPKGVQPFTATAARTWERSPELKEEEFTRAVTLGLFDYLRKSRARGFVVSLSGGADSCAVAALVAMMVELGVGELGLKGFLGRLGYLEELRGAKTPHDIVGRMLTCIYQGTANNSAETRISARALAAEVGAQFLEFEIDSLVDSYTAMVSSALERSLSWERDDIALQNIQARVRSPGAWLVANMKNALLLATSDRSESAVGYATMDGDTSGGLNPIGGIDKPFLRRWLRWLETRGPHGGTTLAALKHVNALQPSPELRPPAAHQEAQKDLMPYEVLDAIERLAIRDKKTPLEVFQVLTGDFHDKHAPATLGAWVERFFILWCRNQWKRERLAPSFHVDDENLDPKTWCRFPILSGNFDRELAELRRALNGRSRG
jgi:NAD+ synthase (glutamine-hydrolysing)